MKAKISLKNIGYYLQGNARTWLRNHFPKVIDRHISEQFELRVNQVGEKSPECLSEEVCKMCGCHTLEMLISDKICSGNCYPEFLNKEDWEVFKKENNLKF